MKIGLIVTPDGVRVVPMTDGPAGARAALVLWDLLADPISRFDEDVKRTLNNQGITATTRASKKSRKSLVEMT